MNENISVEQITRNNTLSKNREPDEINLLEYIYALVKSKWLILGVTLLGFISGYVIACIIGPKWVAEVVITPKESETRNPPSLSSFGGLGGFVANQLNIGGNASIEKIDLLLSSRNFNARLIKKYNLIPNLYRYNWPKVYAQEWDSSSNNWKKSFKKPDILSMGAFLKGKFLKKNIEDNLLTLEIHSSDSALSYNLANMYIEFLDEDIKNSVRNDAKENVDFLEKQLITIADPLLREKIQALIADEIEKTMVVSKEAFTVVDPVYVMKRFKEKKLFPVAFGSILFILTTCITVLCHAFSLAKQTEENRLLIRKIKKQLYLN